ncbi:hypothetical protein SDRG_14044 [Saprolegnia diclina VS20]|uniref:RRP15-like protein n=1 Tax=Saprolegnia diclina (strain VS20) TaxID=1156394 RepID=T0Q457_SAPDV|nr:hypothetical protein SDRG_14044 [Saprolegnia diclina VS20]EQC28220.1 hypothetical protein SDRG_14044 [Saprolegnia diclina VS20]|eukprot:XP_008618369.1 hypothetical protein SDRG_14044 [Saprolegnia diclina VS20]
MKLTMKAKHKPAAAKVTLAAPAKTEAAPASDASADEGESGSEDEGSADNDVDADHESEDEPDDMEENDIDDDEEDEGAVGFADAMSKVLGQNIDTEKAPILAKRITAQMREISKDKKETTESKISAKAKRLRDEKDMVIPSVATMAQDKALRTIATKGVVALFNAIAKHQHATAGTADTKSKEIKSMDKDAFLGLLKQSSKKPATDEPKPEASTWSVVQDDFMMGAKMKDWDKDDDEAADADDWNVELDSDEDASSRKTKKKAPAAKGGKKPVTKGAKKPAAKKQKTK